MKYAVVKIATVLVALFGSVSIGVAGEFSKPWFSKKSSIVLDAYEYTPIDWSKIQKNKRLVGFINKASDGLSPKYNCRGDKLCRVTWRRYSAARELYHTRKVLAKTLGLKWGAYHLARPGNPIEQAQHFLQFAKPDKDDLIALDIEDNDPKRWMSFSDAEIFARYIKLRTGRYPVLYTNHSTAKFIAENRDKYALLARLNLWYARYKPRVRGVFPMGNWKSYSMWQFSSMVNCNKRRCPWRIRGADNWIDVNVVNMAPSELKKQWPLSRRLADIVPTEPETPMINPKRKINPKELMFMANASVGVIPTTTHASIPPIDLAAVTFPKWRPDAFVINRDNYRTSDQIRVALSREIAPLINVSLPAQSVEKIAFEPVILPKPWEIPGAI